VRVADNPIDDPCERERVTRDTLYRATPSDLEIRGDGRTVVGISVPFNDPALIETPRGNFRETFERGAFSATIAAGAAKVKFLAQHQQQSMPLGRAVVLREDANGLYSEFRVSKTVAGDEALELIRDGALDALSIGFQPVKDRWSRDRSSVVRESVRLREVSAVSWPAYSGAQILAVRSDGTLPPRPPLTRAQALIRISELESM
jgi:HK97 family phage prohead protease